MAIKITEIRDNVQILKGTVQKQMILHYVLFQTKKMLFVVVISTTTSPKIQFASIMVANGQQRLLAVPLTGFSLLCLTSFSDLGKSSKYFNV